jgi:hypothetical protein
MLHPDAAATPPYPSRAPWRDLLAWITLALAALAIFWPLGLTNRIPAGVDALTYFTPYWAYRMAAFRAGSVPLWNPYLFLGAPFLANPQAAVLYPLHWPLSWLSPSAALVWSALLHAWLAAGFTYTFARRSLGLTRPAAWLAGLLFGLGGFTLAHVENINQLNGLAWLPAQLWLLDETCRAIGWRGRIRWGAGLTLVLALQFLAGHTQTTFINLVGLGLYALGPILWDLATERHAWTAAHTRTALARLIPLLTLAPALLLCAAQLLPTLELNTLGLRTGGLPYRQAVSFSLRPRLLAQSLLPPYAGGLSEAFGSEGYAEFVSYVGLAGLALAAIGAYYLLRRGPRSANPAASQRRAAWIALLLLVAAGFLLALGGYDPLYYVLWRIVPGFALFRAPARWLALYTLGVACLAGLGLDAWMERHFSQPLPQPLPSDGRGAGWRARLRWRLQLRWSPSPPFLLREGGAGGLGFAGSGGLGSAATWGLGLLLVLAILALLAYQQFPRLLTVAGWAAALVIVGLLLWWGRRRSAWARAGLLTLALAELWVGSRALPYVQAAAPSVVGLRNAPAALLAATADQPPAGRDRFLSLSDIRFDPGDLAELRSAQAGRLSSDAIERGVRAAKQVEVIAPNLSLLLNLPAVDGYDGGVLPLHRYVELEQLFLPADRVSSDGRLREYLTAIPPDRLLDLTGTRFAITDKQNDLWAADVYYDLEQSVTLEPGRGLSLNLSSYPAFSATAAGVVSYLAPAAPGGAAVEIPAGQPVAEITFIDAAGRAVTLPIRAGEATAWGASADTGNAGRVTVARTWPASTGAEGRDYLARLPFPAPLTPVSMTVRALPDAPGALILRGLSLIDARTAAHTAITLSPRGDFRLIHSGDVKVYERTAALGRAWLVHGAQGVADDAAGLAALARPDFDPAATVALEGEPVALPPAAALPSEKVTVEAYTAEHIALCVHAERPGFLVLADATYPGWQATVDGQPTPVRTANLLFRAVSITPGDHQVTFNYRPVSWQRGVALSLAAAVALIVLCALTLFPRRPSTPDV